jgi:predicted CoA-substrate-specific enzyme activase
VTVFVVGVDIGSITAKAVVLDRAGTVVAAHVLDQGLVNAETPGQCLDEALQLAGLSRHDLACIVTTGYGRELVDFGDLSITEISCHAEGVHHLLPEVRTVIDVGGQDSKVIALDDRGNVAHFRMNDRCAAGTGRFIEVIATALRVPLAEIGGLALTAEKVPQVSSTCAVFAESEIISLSAQGHPKVDIIAGMHGAICRRLAGMVRAVGVRERVAMTGGVAKNIGVVRFLDHEIGTTLLIPDEPQIIGALGAARFALHEAGLATVPADAASRLP